MEASSIYTLSPSFNSYSSQKLTEIAARVVDDFKQEQYTSSEAGHHKDIFIWDDHEPEKTSHLHAQVDQNEQKHGESCEEEEEDGEFEFCVACRSQELSPISADEIFYNGQIKPTYPVFNRERILFQDFNHLETKKDAKTSSTCPPNVLRLTLRKLFIEEERDTTTSFSLDGADHDELEGAQPGTYCVWKPKEGCQGEQYKKSNSIESSSKRWKLKDLLHTSKNDGKETFVFLPPLTKKTTHHKEKKERDLFALKT